MISGPFFVIFRGIYMWLIIAAIIIISIIIVLKVIDNRYYQFVKEHSKLLINLREINQKYHFRNIEVLDLEHPYDSETNYNNVSCEDYLIYNLRFMLKRVEKAMSDTLYNYNEYDFYIENVNELTYNDKYNVEVPFHYTKRLVIIENKLFQQEVLKPTTIFKINVKLILIKMNNDYVTSKIQCFNRNKVEELIERLNDKHGDRYNDEGIWGSIERVERGRVSNKMRFSIYEKDNYRCRKCKRRTDDLEIDHIIPIAKGGKSEYNNLQTLCRRCNMNKSDIIEPVTSKTFNPNLRYCKTCKAPLKIVNGKYGKFYGCSNYPKCDYKEKI